VKAQEARARRAFFVLERDEGACKLCGACASACPAGAISVSEGRFSLDASSCIACYGCVVVCESRALAAKWRYF